MDYEKKYKEALNWMKDVYPTLEGAEKEDAEHYFPELKESEDDRIRKNIKIALMSMEDNLADFYSTHRTSQKELLAWLEKQGEKTSDNGKSNLLTVERAMEISPFMKSGFENESVGRSEEDKKMFDSIINVLEVTPSASFIPIKRETMIPWLKSLKERVKPKQKQELNEDTQQWIDAIIKDYEEWYKVNKDHSATIQIKINILKSLKERYTWKPSEEQLETLENVRKILHSNKEIYSKINHFMFNFEELIRTLKKLREE